MAYQAQELLPLSREVAPSNGSSDDLHIRQLVSYKKIAAQIYSVSTCPIQAQGKLSNKRDDTEGAW